MFPYQISVQVCGLWSQDQGQPPEEKAGCRQDHIRTGPTHTNIQGHIRLKWQT